MKLTPAVKSLKATHTDGIGLASESNLNKTISLYHFHGSQLKSFFSPWMRYVKVGLFLDQSPEYDYSQSRLSESIFNEFCHHKQYWYGWGNSFWIKKVL